MKSMHAFQEGQADSVQAPGGVPGKSTLTSRIARMSQGNGGAALPSDVRTRFEGSLGSDLGDVRVHTGPASEHMAASVDAQAFAVGNDIHFGAGKYQPDDPFGMHLLAHEVAHTQQQRGATIEPQAKLEVSEGSDASEADADRAADAMVAGAPAQVASLGPSAARRIHRSPTEAKAPAIGEATVPAHALTAEDKTDLDWTITVVKKAAQDHDYVLGILESYADAAPGLLAEIKEIADGTISKSQAAFEKVNDTITKAKEIAKLQKEVLIKLVSGVYGNVVGNLVSRTESEITKAVSSFSTGMDELKSLAKDGYGELKEIVDKATEKPDSDGGLEQPWVKELAFFKSFAELHAQSTKLLPMAVKLARLGKPIGKLEEAAANTKKSGRTDADYPIARMRKDAQRLQQAAKSLGDGAERVPKVLADLKKVHAQTKATAPKTKLDAEKELWLNWIAGLTDADKELLDLDVIENYLKKNGLWTQLGLDIGNWFSGDDQDLAVCMANAQAKVLAHKGETVPITKGKLSTFMGTVSSTTVELEGLPELPAEVTGNTSPVTAGIVVGARASFTVDPEVLKTVKGKEEKTALLLKRRYVTVQLKGVSTPAASDATGEG